MLQAGKEGRKVGRKDGRMEGRMDRRMEGRKERLLKLELRSDSKSNPFQDISSAVGAMC